MIVLVTLYQCQICVCLLLFDKYTSWQHCQAVLRFVFFFNLVSFPPIEIIITDTCICVFIPDTSCFITNLNGMEQIY